MAFSMHSHSGQFCPGHAKNTLEECIQAAISCGMHTFALTEHMPRTSNEDLYPEEISAGESIFSHLPRHAAFINESLRLRSKYHGKIHLPIGFEAEWIRPSYAAVIHDLAADPAIDFFIGSVHHVHGIPIDYDATTYARARARVVGDDHNDHGNEEMNDAALFAAYFDAQWDMLMGLRPRVVGHFDLIRLLSACPDADLARLPHVWARVRRNLAFIVEYGGLVEVNSSALRKGLREPYPMRSVCRAFLDLGGKLTLSDDSHGIDQVATCYVPAVSYVESLGVQEVWCLDVKERPGAEAALRMVSLDTIKASLKS